MNPEKNIKIRWCTQKQLADKLGIKLDHLYYYIKTDKCKTLRKFGRLLVDADFSFVPRKNKTKGGA